MPYKKQVKPLDDDLARCSCGTRFMTVESRARIYGNSRTVFRRKLCGSCGKTARTIEVPATMADDLFADD